MKSLDEVDIKVKKFGISCDISVDKLVTCSDVESKMIYPTVSRELDVIDEQVTILSVTMNMSAFENKEFLDHPCIITNLVA